MWWNFVGRSHEEIVAFRGVGEQAGPIRPRRGLRRDTRDRGCQVSPAGYVGGWIFLWWFGR
jgi:hypothetical protein